MVVVPHEPGALVHGIIIGGGAGRRVGAGHVHETGAGHPRGVKPLEGGAVAEPGGKAAVQVGGDAVQRQLPHRLLGPQSGPRHDGGVDGDEGLDWEAGW